MTLSPVLRFSLIGCPRNSLPQEINLIYLSRWTALKCIYLAGRFLPIVLWPIAMWLMVGDHTLEECKGKELLIEHLIFMVLQLVPHGVLAIRAYAYTGRTREVRILLALGMCGYIGTQVWAYLIKESRRLDPSLFQLLGRTGCYRDARMSKRPFAYVMITGTVIDCMSIALTVSHAITTMGINGKLRMVFLLQGISLFVFMFCANIMTSVSFFNRPSEPWEVVCFALVLLVPNSVACRFILELRAITAGQAETDIIVHRFGRAVDDYLAQENAQQEE
ncbi:hypothetical protein D9756_010476 [Leucocoprinus leucothites]|uniref:Transmembrane protein n=1 Tax=Leucocoprinus leucothites TaxID=201217 RepID=A0A8H5FTC4_9AGAR|nr:hypothetical protein D9756_010476 [Leucoagaricus leucothites]